MPPIAGQLRNWIREAVPGPVYRALVRRKLHLKHDSAYWAKKRLESLDLLDDLLTVHANERQRIEYDRNKVHCTISTNSIVEINNTCNIDCLMCKTSLTSRPRGVMREDVFDRALERIREYGSTGLSLHTLGDPLANPRLPVFLELCRKHGLRTGLSTNGLLLRRRIETLLQYMDVCRSIRFSIDGASKATYERIRAGGSWEDLLENIELARERLFPAKFEFATAMVVSKDNYQEIGDFVVRFREYVLAPYHDMSFGFVNSLSPDNSYFDATKLFSRFVGPTAPCLYISNPMPFVLIDGSVSICCRDYDGSLVVGHIEDGPISEIFRKSEGLQKLRQAHEAGDLANHRLCGTCFKTDARLDSLFRFFMARILHRHPGEKSGFYQERADRFRSIFETLDGDPLRVAYRELLDSL